METLSRSERIVLNEAAELLQRSDYTAAWEPLLQPTPGGRVSLGGFCCVHDARRMPDLDPALLDHCGKVHAGPWAAMLCQIEHRLVCARKGEASKPRHIQRATVILHDGAPPVEAWSAKEIPIVHEIEDFIGFDPDQKSFTVEGLESARMQLLQIARKSMLSPRGMRIGYPVIDITAPTLAERELSSRIEQAFKANDDAAGAEMFAQLDAIQKERTDAHVAVPMNMARAKLRELRKILSGEAVAS